MRASILSLPCGEEKRQNPLHGSCGRTTRCRTFGPAANSRTHTLCLCSRGAIHPSHHLAFARHDKGTRLDRFFCLCSFFSGLFCAIPSRTIKSRISEMGLDRFYIQHPNAEHFQSRSRCSDSPRLSDLTGVSFYEVSCGLFSALSKGHFAYSGRSHFLLHHGVCCNRGDEF